MKAPPEIAGYKTDHGKYVFDEATALKSVRFFTDCLQHPTDSYFTRKGDPFELAPWQADVTATMFGWKDQAGRRRYKTVYIEIPRKNGKTSIAAAWCAYAMYCDGYDCQIFAAAASKDQSSLLYRKAAVMIRESPVLSQTINGRKVKIRDHTKRILLGDSYIQAVAADGDTIHGTQVHMAILDEIHVWKKDDVYTAFQTGLASSPEPLLIMITTAGFDRTSFCWRQHEYATRVRDGVIDDPTFLPVIYGVDEEEDWTDQEVWERANPSWGYSVNPEVLEDEFRRATNEPLYENKFRQYHLNQWTRTGTRWISDDTIQACEKAASERREVGPAPMALPIPDGVEVYAGLDLSQVRDLTAWCIMWLRDDDWVWCNWRFYMADELVDKQERSDRVPYRDWIRRGWITPTYGSKEIDYSFLIRDIAADHDRWRIRLCGYDPHNSGMLDQVLQREYGLKMAKVIPTAAQVNSAILSMAKKFEAVRVDWGGNPVARWMIENVEVTPNYAGELRMKKPAAETEGAKIDGAAALQNAFRAMEDEPPRPPSVYLNYEKWAGLPKPETT